MHTWPLDLALLKNDTALINWTLDLALIRYKVGEFIKCSGDLPSPGNSGPALEGRRPTVKDKDRVNVVEQQSAHSQLSKGSLSGSVMRTNGMVLWWTDALSPLKHSMNMICLPRNEGLDSLNDDT